LAEAAAPAASYWPRLLPRHLEAPLTTLTETLEVSAHRFAARPAIHSFGLDISYAELLDQVERFAGWLQQKAGVQRGDRVLLYLQNSAQWIIAYYGILRADAVVVPVNPMNRSSELAHYLTDSGACVAVCAQDLLAQLEPAAKGTALREIVVATYSDYVPAGTDYTLPAWLREPRQDAAGRVAWSEVLSADIRPQPSQAQPDDLCGLPYTSGSTGVPRACMHTHRSFMHNTAGMALWHWTAPATAFLCVAPMYHVAGLSHSLHLPIFVGGTLVVLPRWERELALKLMSRQRVGHAAIPPTAIIDLLSHPDLAQHDLSGLRRITAGGAAMPAEVWRKLNETLGLDFIEGYGMTETAATTHNNPIDRPKRQCLGVPFFDTESLVVDPVTLEPLPQGEEGEILVSGPQLFQGYWGRPKDTAAALVEIGGRRFLRTGDIGRVDEEGYYFMTDRAKRMINASGYKVWPAEVEAVLYQHPDVKEVCVIGTQDAYRGESVKALVVPHEHARASLTPEALIAWSREKMAAYKYPRLVEIVEQLPKSPVGKILWRELQERESGQPGRPLPQ
jgi:fatty-acyl-CoA synthase